MTQVVPADQYLFTFPNWGPFITLPLLCVFCAHMNIDILLYLVLVCYNSLVNIVRFFQCIANGAVSG